MLKAIERRFWYVLMFLGVWMLPRCSTFRHGYFTWPTRNPYWLVPRWRGRLLLRGRFATWVVRRYERYRRQPCTICRGVRV